MKVVGIVLVASVFAKSQNCSWSPRLNQLDCAVVAQDCLGKNNQAACAIVTRSCAGSSEQSCTIFSNSCFTQNTPHTTQFNYLSKSRTSLESNSVYFLSFLNCYISAFNVRCYADDALAFAKLAKLQGFLGNPKVSSHPAAVTKVNTEIEACKAFGY